MSNGTGKIGYMALRAYIDNGKKELDEGDFTEYGIDWSVWSKDEWLTWYLYRNAKLPVEERDSDYEFFRYAEELGMDPWSEEYLHCEYPAHMDVIDTHIKMLRIRRAIRLWVEE